MFIFAASTAEQLVGLEAQVRELKAAGFAEIFSDGRINAKPCW